jgi:Domain of unknown function (DUF932)
MELMQVSRQWATRPSDERFVSLYELAAKMSKQRTMSRAPVVSSRDLQIQPATNDSVKGLQIVGKAGNPFMMTNWSFGQLATLAGAPAGYLRKLPAPIAADAMNYGMRFERDIEDVGLLITKDGDEQMLRAATGPRYGRVWNEEIAEALIAQHGDGRTGKFRIPGEFGKAVDITKANTTIYGSDRDMFVFLADETNRVEMKDRRAGQRGTLARGFFVWNSEVGSTSIGAAFFLFDYACSNRIIWGAEQYREIRINHTKSAPHRWVEEITPVLEDYANSSATKVEETIRQAQAKKVDDDLDAFLAKRFSGTQATAIKAAHEREEGRPIETLWDAVTGVTAYAKTIEHQDNRVAMERIGGKLLDLVAA